MLITFLATGTRGDVQPYLALGVALRQAGHQVRVATFGNFAALVTGCGLELAPITGDVAAAAVSDIAQEAMKADNPIKFLVSFNKMKALADGLQKEFYNACLGSDRIVYHPGAPIGYFAAQHLQIPSILASPFPMTPTRDYPALIFYDMPRLGRAFNLLTHKIFAQAFWSATGRPVKQFWKQTFGRAPQNFGAPYDRETTIVSISKHVFPRPADWPARVHACGYWFLAEEGDWQPPRELLAFLEQGPPPVYVGFGSIGERATAEQTTRQVLDALQRSGQRGVVATGWSGMTRLEEAPENVFMLDSAPHAWLFPRMAAVVHHGGAGTTAAGLHAGVPGIVVPHANDQFAWGRRIYELGVGAKPIPKKQLSAERLAAAIEFALSPGVKDAASTLGRKIQAENGAEEAARIILAG